MLWKVKKSKLNGTITVPSSKSHTIRALLIATLAQGESVIKDCLLECDGKSALDAAIVPLVVVVVKASPFWKITDSPVSLQRISI